MRSAALPALFCSVVMCAALVEAAPASAEKPGFPFEPQLEVLVPWEPTLVTSDGQQHLLYELQLRNFGQVPLVLEALRVVVADDLAAPLASFDAESLPSLFNRSGTRQDNPKPPTQIDAGVSTVLFLQVSFAADAAVPPHVRHELQTTDGTVVTYAIDTRHDRLQVLGPPLIGSGWQAETGFSNNNGHRRGGLVLGGRSVISRRYAYDWIRVEEGALSRGDDKVTTSYFGYGEPVVAVADATVVAVIDGVPDNIPKQAPVVPITLDTVGGNVVVLDIGHGQYAHYMHLQPGSIAVKQGERVRRGQQLARVGNTGDSHLPHMHFELTTSPEMLRGQGLPYVLDAFDVLSSDGSVSRRSHELPTQKALVQFGN